MEQEGADITTIKIAPQTGALVTLQAGSRLRIVDVDGSQVADMFAVSVADHNEWLSVTTTRTASGRLFPTVGEHFLTHSYQPLLRFERDDTPGVHDMLAAPCSALMYELLDFVGYHPSCSENFRTAAERIGWHPLTVPDPVNFFQNMPVGPDGETTPLPAVTAPGDSVTLLADIDVHVIVTACSMDLEPINGDRPSSLRLEIDGLLR